MTPLRDQIKLHEGLVYDRHAYGKGPGWDPELIIEKTAAPSELEQEGYDVLSDVELEIFYHKMLTIVEEAREVWQNLSISDIILAGDMSTAIFTPSGDLAVASTGIHFHALLNYAQSKFILKYYRYDPTVGLNEGDIFFFNNPLAGSTHAPDMFTAMPVFYEGQLVAWAEVGGHQGDCGSVAPGGFNPYATSRFEEGFHMGGVKIGENFRIRKDMLDYLCGSVRNPFVFAVELRSRVATCLRMRDRLLREVERRGPAVVAGGLRRLIDRSSELASERLRQVNDGIYRSILFNDTIGAEKGLVRVPTTVIKEGGEMTILVQGVSPPNGKGPVHATWHLVRASQAVYLFAYFFRGLMPNVGLFEPLTFLIEGPFSGKFSRRRCAYGRHDHLCGGRAELPHHRIEDALRQPVSGERLGAFLSEHGGADLLRVQPVRIQGYRHHVYRQRGRAGRAFRRRRGALDGVLLGVTDRCGGG